MAHEPTGAADCLGQPGPLPRTSMNNTPADTATHQVNPSAAPHSQVAQRFFRYSRPSGRAPAPQVRRNLAQQVWTLWALWNKLFAPRRPTRSATHKRARVPGVIKGSLHRAKCQNTPKLYGLMSVWHRPAAQPRQRPKELDPPSLDAAGAVCTTVRNTLRHPQAPSCTKRCRRASAPREMPKLYGLMAVWYCSAPKAEGTCPNKLGCCGRFRVGIGSR